MTRFARQGMTIALAAGLMALGGCNAGDSEAEAARDAQITELMDRVEITDLVTRYYVNFSLPEREDFTNFYTEDAELVFGNGDRVLKGYEGIESAYGGGERDEDAPPPPRRTGAFNVDVGNVLIELNGDVARARMTFTEFLTDEGAREPRVLVQGHEFDKLVKRDGVWKIKRRQIMDGGATVPTGWDSWLDPEPAAE